MSDWELACLARFNKREEEYQEAALLNKLGRNLATFQCGGGRCGRCCHTLYCTQRCATKHWCEHKKVCKESPEIAIPADFPPVPGAGGRCANCGDEFTFLCEYSRCPPRLALIMATERQLFNATPVVPMFCDDDSDDDAHECFVIGKNHPASAGGNDFVAVK